jgi:hypothetical protein
LFIKRPEYSYSRVSPNRLLVLAVAALLFFFNSAYPQVSPYITDVVGEDGVVVSAGGEDGDDGDLRLIGTFKIFNPDTVPFYLWLTFKNGGKLEHSRRGDSPPVRLIDMELRYRDATHRPIVKELPDNTSPRVRRRLGWTSPRSASDRRFGRKKAHVERPENTTASVRHRSMGAIELVFWQEEVQAYYEMELWGVLYASDLKKVVAKGRYFENIKLEIESAVR